jgi:hypothetical protein
MRRWQAAKEGSMNVIWPAILNNLVSHWGAYSAAFSVLFVASVCTMPSNPPVSFRELWQWVRDALQTAIPAARHTVIPQQAEEINPDQESRV